LHQNLTKETFASLLCKFLECVSVMLVTSLAIAAITFHQTCNHHSPATTLSPVPPYTACQLHLCGLIVRSHYTHTLAPF